MNSDLGLSSTGQNPKGVIAMILAAGLGTRLKPWTNFHPKALAMVNGKSLLQRNIEYLQSAGIYKVVINVHHFADQIVAAIKKHNGWGSEVTISDETEEVLETGGGFLKAASFLTLSNHIVLMNVDVLTNLNLTSMISYHLEKMPLATLATTNRKTSRYFLFNQDDHLCGWQNTLTGQVRSSTALKGDENQKAFSGIHVISRQFFDFVQESGKCSMVDFYLQLMQNHVIKSFDHSGSKFIDVGKPESIEAAEKMFL